MERMHSDSSFIVEMRGIRKTFPGIVANDNITLQVKKQSIHALLGENGSGKSTLMSVLFGLLSPDEGDIYLRGKKVVIDNPHLASNLGIGMVHQHFQLIDTFTVAENIVLGIETKKSFNRLDLRDSIRKIKALSEKYKLHIDPNALVRDIPVSMQQRVEILKMLYRNAEFMIFDEPTAVLVPSEIEELMKIMKILVAEGKSIILITHKLNEIKQVAEYCTILRRGKRIGTVEIAKTDESDLAQMMVGRTLKNAMPKKKNPQDDIVLEIRNLSVKNRDKVQTVQNVSFDVKKGEILGIAGVEGNGQIELFETLIGVQKQERGEILLENTPIEQLSILQRIQSGVGIIPEDRQKHGIIPEFSLAQNLALKKYRNAPYSKHGLLNFSEINKQAERLIEDFDIRSSQGAQSITGSMSGGNQQKAIISREIDNSPKLLLVVQPTRGLDIGAIEYIHERLVAERNKGCAILLVSMELDEVTKLSDRIAVMYNGSIANIIPGKNVDKVALGLMMIGKTHG